MAAGPATTPQGSPANTPTPLTQSEAEDRVATAFVDSLDLGDAEDGKASAAPESDEPTVDDLPDDPAEEATDEADDEDGEAETDEAADDEADAPPPKKQPGDDVKVSLDDGSEVTLRELKRGFLREADYTRKTQDVAQQRKAVEQERGTLTQFSEQQTAALQIVHQILQETLPPDPDPALIAQNPELFYRQKALHEQGQARLRFLQQTYQHNEQQKQVLAQQSGHQTSEQFQQFRQAEMQKLEQKFPDLKTSEAKAKLLNEIVEVGGKSWGITAADVANVVDHREIAILRDAVAYRKLQSAKMQAVRKAKEAPKTPHLKPGTRPAPGARSKARQQEAAQKLRREGTIEAALGLLDDKAFNL